MIKGDPFKIEYEGEKRQARSEGLTSSSNNRGHYSGRGEDDKDITFLNSYHHLPWQRQIHSRVQSDDTDSSAFFIWCQFALPPSRVSKGTWQPVVIALRRLTRVCVCLSQILRFLAGKTWTHEVECGWTVICSKSTLWHTFITVIPIQMLSVSYKLLLFVQIMFKNPRYCCLAWLSW